MKIIHLSLIGLLFSLISYGQVNTRKKENFIESSSLHCCHEQRLDTAEYKIMEEKLKEALQKPNFSSHAVDYMKSDAYKKYKSYICKHPEYIDLMFQSFLFQESVKGLYGHLIDDIVKYRYPEAPSIWIMATKANHKDSETTVILKYQRSIKQLINEERNKKKSSTDSISVNLNQPNSILIKGRSLSIPSYHHRQHILKNQRNYVRQSH